MGGRRAGGLPDGRLRPVGALLRGAVVRQPVMVAAAAGVALFSAPAADGASAPDGGRPFEPAPVSQPLYAIAAPAENPGRQQHVVLGADGTRIFTETWLPKAKDGHAPPPRLPTVLHYSPYLARGVPGSAGHRRALEHLVARGYAYTTAHVTGTGASEGCVDPGSPHEVDDGARVVEYVGRDAPWSNGRVGMDGLSYPGGTQAQVAALGDPSRTQYLKAIVPVAPAIDWYDGYYQDGVPWMLVGAASQAATYFLQSSVLVDPEGAVQQAPVKVGCQPGVLSATLDSSGDKSAFWQERDSRRGVGRIRAATLVAQGHLDDRVPSFVHSGFSTAVLMPGRSRKSRAPTVSGARSPTGRLRAGLLGSSRSARAVRWGRPSRKAQLHIWSRRSRRPVGTYPPGTAAVFETAALADRLEITGMAMLDAWVSLDQNDAHVAAKLEALDRNGRPTSPESRAVGLRSAQHLDPLVDGRFVQEHRRPAPIGTPFRLALRFTATSLVVPKGGRLRLTLAGSVIVDDGLDGLINGAGAIFEGPSQPSASLTRVSVLHDCAHASVLRFVMPRSTPDLLNVRESDEPQAAPLSDNRPSRPSVSGGAGIATAPVCGRAPHRHEILGASIDYPPPLRLSVNAAPRTGRPAHTLSLSLDRTSAPRATADAGTLIRFATKQARTDARGRASMVAVLPRPRRYRARALKPGFSTASASVRVRRAR